MIDADCPAKMGHVCATAHRHMLAGIDQESGGRIGKRAGAASESSFGFVDCDLETERRQSGRRGESGETTADDDDGGVLCTHQVQPQRTGSACTTNVHFRQVLKLTRPLKTS